jgi:hypothetical protein
MAGKMKGLHPRDFQKSTVVRTTGARFEIPRLPAPIAIRAPCDTREPTVLSSSSARTAPATSFSALCGKFWRIGTKRGTPHGIPVPDVSQRPDFPEVSSRPVSDLRRWQARTNVSLNLRDDRNFEFV